MQAIPIRLFSARVSVSCQSAAKWCVLVIVKTPTPCLFTVSISLGTPTLIAMGAKPKSPSTLIAFWVKNLFDGLEFPFTFLLLSDAIYPGILNNPWDADPSLSAVQTVLATALELVGSGESSGSFAEILIDNQKTNKVSYR